MQKVKKAMGCFQSIAVNMKLKRKTSAIVWSVILDISLTEYLFK